MARSIATVLATLAPVLAGCSIAFGVYDLDAGKPPTDAPPPSTSIAFVQYANGYDSKNPTSLTATFDLPQTQGNLNIVTVAWFDDLPNEVTVTDSTGKNTYKTAVPLYRVNAPCESLSQTVFYATNIAPDAPNARTTVTVTWKQPASSPDVEMLEYSGVSSLDVDATASLGGNSLTAEVGPIPTSHASELLFAAGISNASIGFTKPMGTDEMTWKISAESDIVEGRILSQPGMYSAGAIARGTKPSWVFQVAGFY
jgi:hypothetical protein